MSYFKVINTNFNNISAFLNTREFINLRDAEKTAAKARNISNATTIKLTYSENDYTLPAKGLHDLLVGLINPSIQDYTGGSVEGYLRLPYSDSHSSAARIIQQFKLSGSRPRSVVYFTRETSGGMTPLNFGTFQSTFNNVKIARSTSGIQEEDAASVQLWTTGDSETDGFYVYIQGISFRRGRERVRLIVSQHAPPLTEPTCCRYSSTATFDKYDFIQTLHPEYSLNAWCYFGRLTGNSNTYAFTFLIQKTIPFTLPYVHHKLEFDIAGGFNTSTLADWQIDGCASSSGPIVKSDPWSVGATCNTGAVPANLTSLSVQNISGTVGTPGATYKLLLEAIISDDFHVNPVYIEVEVTDVLGTVNEGFGPDAFLPNWLTDQQRTTILTQYSGSVEAYLAAGIDDLNCQGSYYFSQPLLQVNDFTIYDLQGNILDTKAPGNDSVLWFDYVAQSFNAQGLEIIKDVGWEFFAIQFPGNDQAIMVTKITTQTSGVYLLANLFTSSGVTRWNIDDIDIQGSNVWTSTTGKQYYTTYTITLTNPDATITVQADWDNQEISVGGQTKYEGICTVTATVLGTPMNGFSWIEQQALN